MKKRWISLYVENEVGVLSKITGLFSAKSYNLESLTVGKTEDETISRLTIGLTSDDITFEQIKKQLNRSVSIIKVIDLTNIPIHMKEILFVKINGCQEKDKVKAIQIAQIFKVKVTDYGKNNILLECVQTEGRNNDMIQLLRGEFGGKIEVVRGGSVAVEAITIEER